MEENNLLDEDWDLLTSFFPEGWRELARETNAVKGLRQDKSEESLLRVLLIHLVCGCSLRETAVRAREAQLADLSDVAVLKRLRKSQAWLYGLCRGLFEERGMRAGNGHIPMRLIDATNVKEPGKTGSLWRVHYSLQWPSFACDFFKLTPFEGEGNGESLKHIPLAKGDHLIADRGYCHASGIHYAAKRGALVIVRVNVAGLVLEAPDGRPFPLMGRLKTLTKPMKAVSWEVQIPSPKAGGRALSGRLCAMRKSQEAIQRAHKKLKRRASKNGSQLQAQTLFFAQYVIVFTTFAPDQFTASQIMEWYRLRWQIELVFKRFKQIAQLGHLPKRDPESAKSWLYGKLFAALLTEKLIAAARSLSPWGYVHEIGDVQRMA